MLAKRFVIALFIHPNLIFFRFTPILFLGISVYSSAANNPCLGSGPVRGSRDRDTVFLPKGRYFIFKSTSITIPCDTFYLMPHEKTTRRKVDPDQDSHFFYDTVYKKFSRTKITQLLYNLAFVVPKQSDLPDSLQVLKSVSPFEAYHGKIIRKVTITILPPFGASIYDTAKHATTGIGKALNSVHINTRKYVIKRNLLFKPGDRVNPAILADNERLLRNMNAIDNARIIVVPSAAGSDSVDLVIVAKDVWSIGLDVPLITPQQTRIRIYDANFLGLGDQFTTSFSFHINRMPFCLFEGFSYTYNNIASSQINATVAYAADDHGNKNMIIRFDRSFLTNITKWAGSAYISYETFVSEYNGHPGITSYFFNEGLWLGRAYLLKGRKETSRAVLSAALYRKHYTSRPIVTIDSNVAFYNQLQVLTEFSISRNNYYLTDYVMDFGKTENLPYGHLLQLTIGADQGDFYTRLYTGIHLSAGNFFNGFGYISTYVKLGGFFNHDSFEDAVVKFNLHYFTPLMKTRDKRYRFRAFLSADYRYAFNSRSNSRDYYDANLDFKINKVSDPDYFNGVNIISGRLATICFTPWYFYGFRFALMMAFQSGMVGQRNEPFYHASFFSSVGCSIIIKNSNLIFPAFLLSGFYYPSVQDSFRQLQFMIGSKLNVQYYDFNVNAPHEENLGN